jgi:DNA repair protein RadC
MSQLSLSFYSLESSQKSPLLVRDMHGRYLPASADEILEAARQIVDQKMQRGAVLESPLTVRNYLRSKLAGLEHEVFAVVFLDSRHRLIEYVEMFRGTVDGAAVYPREVVKKALQLNAAAAIVSHNHPSGVPDPSRADELITKQLRDALALVDVRVLDHVIVAGSATASFVERGLM